MKTVLFFSFFFLFLHTHCTARPKEELSPNSIKDHKFPTQSTNPELYLPRWQQTTHRTIFKSRHKDYPIESLQEHQSTKDMFFINNATLSYLNARRSQRQLEDIITKAVNADHSTYPSSRVVYIYPNIKSLNRTVPHLIASLNQISEYNDIKDVIAFDPPEIALNKPICIPTLTLLNVTNNLKQNIIILGIKADLYQLSVFVANKDHSNDMSQYLNPKIAYPKELQSGSTITLQLIALPDVIGEVKGNVYLEFIIGQKPFVIVYPIRLIGSENAYRIKPFYYQQWPTAKMLSMPLFIYNPHSSPLIIQEAVNSFSSISLQWPNGKAVADGLSQPIELQPKAKKIVMYMKYLQNSAGVEYGLLQLKTNKDTIIVPVLIEGAPIDLKPNPSYMNFGVISAFHDTHLRAIPIQITNAFKADLSLKAVYLKFDETALEFISSPHQGDCLLKPGETKEIGYAILNPIQALLKERARDNKAVAGRIYIESNSSQHPLSEIDYEYTIAEAERELIQSPIHISMDDIKGQHHLTVTRAINAQFEPELIFKHNKRRIKLKNNLHYEYILNWNDSVTVSFSIENREEFIKENTYYYYLPFYLDEYRYCIIPVVFNDNMIDLLYCNEEIDVDKCKRKQSNNLYRAINNCNDINQREIALDIGSMAALRTYHKHIVLINNNANPILVIVKSNGQGLGIDLMSKNSKVFDLPNIITIGPQSTIKLRLSIDITVQGDITNKIVLEYPSMKVITNITIRARVIQGSLELITGCNFLGNKGAYQSITALSSLDSSVHLTGIQLRDGGMHFNTVLNKEIKAHANTTIEAMTRRSLPRQMPSQCKYLTYRELYLWKSITQKLNATNSTQSSLKLKTSIGDYSIDIASSYCDSLSISPSVIDYGLVQLGHTHEAYINITNNYHEPIAIQPMLFNNNYEASIESQMKLKRYEDINDTISIFECNELLEEKQKKAKGKGQSQFDMTHTIIINQDMANVNLYAINKENLLNFLYDNAPSKEKKAMRSSKRLLCRTSFITKEEVLLRDDYKQLREALFSIQINKEIESIETLTNSSLSHYLSRKLSSKTTNNHKLAIVRALMSFFTSIDTASAKQKEDKAYDSSDYKQEIFLSSSQVQIIQPKQTIRLGPILYHSQAINTVNLSLLVKNNLTLIAPIQIRGSAGAGIAQFSSNDSSSLPLTDTYDIVITKRSYELSLKGKIIKEILLSNVGTLPLNYTALTLENNKCEGKGITLLSCGSLFLEPLKTEPIQFSIEINFDFVTQRQTLVLTSFSGEERRIGIRVINENDLLRLKHHFFSFAFGNERLLTIIIITLMSIAIYLALTKKKDKSADKQLKILSHLDKSTQSNAIEQQNLFIKSYRRYDNVFYEEVLVKMDEDRAEYEREYANKRTHNREMKQQAIKKKPKQPQKQIKPSNHIGLPNEREIKQVIAPKQEQSGRDFKSNLSAESKPKITSTQQTELKEIDLQSKEREDSLTVNSAPHQKENTKDINNKEKSSSSNSSPQSESTQKLAEQTKKEEQKPSIEVSKVKVQVNDDNRLIEQYNSFNPLLTSSLPAQTNPIKRDEIDGESNNDSEDPFNHFKNFHPSNIFLSNNNQSEQDVGRALDSGTEEMKFNFNSIFGSNLAMSLGFNDANENPQQESDTDTSQPYFKAFQSIRSQSVCANPFTQKQAHILTDLYESDEDLNEDKEEAEGKLVKTLDIEELFNAEDEEEEPEWSKEVIDNTTEGYFDETGVYKVKQVYLI